MQESTQQRSFATIILLIALSFPGGLLLFGLLGVGANLFVALPGFLGLVQQPPMAERHPFAVPGSYTFDLPKAGDYMILAEAVGAQVYPLNLFKTAVFDSDGQPIPFAFDGRTVWETEDLEGSRLYTFSIEEPGTYTIQVETNRADNWVLMPNYGRSNQIILITFYLGLIALILITWWGSERWRDRHRKAAAQEKGKRFDKWIDTIES